MLRADELKSTDHIGKSVTIRGWVYRLRKQKENTFLIVRDDRGGVMQTVLPTSIVPANLTMETSVQITGVLNRDKRAQEGGYEIRGSNIEAFNIADSEYPVGEFQSLDLLLYHRHLALRA